MQGHGRSFGVLRGWTAQHRFLTAQRVRLENTALLFCTFPHNAHVPCASICGKTRRGALSMPRCCRSTRQQSSVPPLRRPTDARSDKSKCMRAYSLPRKPSSGARQLPPKSLTFMLWSGVCRVCGGEQHTDQHSQPITVTGGNELETRC